MLALSATCSTKYRAGHDSGARSPDTICYVVLHSTESASARSSAQYFTSPASGGSANLVVDDLSCSHTVPDLVIPWAAPPLNTSGFHIEQAGFAAWSRTRWLAHLLTIRRAAYKAAVRCKTHGIPLTLLGPTQLERIGTHPQPGHGGITTHAAVSAAFHDSSHTDP